MNEVQIRRKGNGFSDIFVNEKKYCGLIEDVGDVTDFIYLLKNVLVGLGVKSVTLVEFNSKGEINKVVGIE